METAADLSIEQAQQNVDLSGLERLGNMPVDAHKRPVGGFHEIAGTIPPAGGWTGISGRLVELAGQFAGGQFIDGDRRHGHGLAVDTHQAFDRHPERGADAVLGDRDQAQRRHSVAATGKSDMTAVLADDRPDFHRAIGHEAFPFDGGTGAAFGGQVGDGHEPGQAVEAIGQTVA